LYPGSDAEHWKIERTSPPQLVVYGIPPIRSWKPHVHQDFIGLLGEIVDSIVLVEPACGDHTLTLGSHEPVFGTDRDHHRGDVRRADGPAARRRRRHPADVAVLLHAEVDRLPPLVALIVVVAARVEAKISAEGAHVAE